MLVVRCKDCGKELISTSKLQVCGCPNMMTLRGDSVTAVDLSRVVMINSTKEKKKKSFFSDQDLAYQEARRKRKVKRIEFEER